MHYLTSLFVFASLLFISLNTHASTVVSVEPDFIKMRHAADVKVTIKGNVDDYHLALVPGGPYVRQSKPVGNISAIHQNLLFNVEDKTQLIIYQAGKSFWQEMGFVDIGAPIEKLFISGKILNVITHDQIFELDISKAARPQIISQHPNNKNLLTIASSGMFSCIQTQDELQLYDIEKKRILASAKTQPGILQLINHQQFCISLSRNHGVQVWQNKENKLSVTAQYTTDNIAHAFQLQNNLLAIADGTTGFTLLTLGDNGQLSWAGSYNKLGNIIQASMSESDLIVADDKGVISVFDISDPSTPLLVSDFHTHQPAISAISFYKKQSYLLSASKIFNVDFSAESSPMISTLGVNQGGSRRSFIENDILYVADWFSGLHLYDIRVPGNPRSLSTFHTPGSPKGVVVKNGVAFVADDDHGLQIIDVSNPRSPKYISDIPLTGLAYTMKLIDNLLYIASHRGGFHIVDVSNPAAPVLVSTYDTPSKAWALEYKNGLLYVADDSTGLMVFDVHNPAQPKLINTFNPGGFAEDVYLRGNIAYVAFFDLGLFVLDISDANNIKQLAHLKTPGNARGIDIKNNLLYLASWEAGVQIIDITDEHSPSIIGHFDTKGAVWGLSVQDQMIYAMDWWGGVKVIDASKPEKPAFVSQYQTAGLINDLVYRDKFIYTAHGSRGLQVYDATNDLNPVWATGVDLSGNANALSINHNLAVVAAGDGGIALVDIANPFQAKLISQLKLDSSIALIKSFSHYVFAAANDGDLYFIDIKNPSAPQLVERVVSHIKALAVNDENLYALTNNRTLTRYSVNKLTEKLVAQYIALDYAGTDLQFYQRTNFVLNGKNTLRMCSVLDTSVQCKKPYSLPKTIIATHIAGNKLYVTADNQSLYVFSIGEDKTLNLNSIYPSSHNLGHISASKYGIFFGGESVIASGKLLPDLPISANKDNFVIKIPKNMPKGAYHLVLRHSDGSQTIKKNAVVIGFPKLKSKFTLEKLKAIMKQKNFAGKAPQKP